MTTHETKKNHELAASHEQGSLGARARPLDKLRIKSQMLP
jgi:hypothetical protein